MTAVANKYLRRITGWASGPGSNGSCLVDVYSVLLAYRVSCPVRGHAIKKLLCAGQRGKGSALQDLLEARQALDRAIEEEQRGTTAKECVGADAWPGRPMTPEDIQEAKEKWLKAAGLIRRAEQSMEIGRGTRDGGKDEFDDREEG